MGDGMMTLPGGNAARCPVGGLRRFTLGSRIKGITSLSPTITVAGLRSPSKRPVFSGGVSGEPHRETSGGTGRPDPTSKFKLTRASGAKVAEGPRAGEFASAFCAVAAASTGSDTFASSALRRLPPPASAPPRLDPPPADIDDAAFIPSDGPFHSSGASVALLPPTTPLFGFFGLPPARTPPVLLLAVGTSSSG